MTSFLSTLSWPGAVAIVGSLVAIGWIVHQFIRLNRATHKDSASYLNVKDSDYHADQLQRDKEHGVIHVKLDKSHKRISEVNALHKELVGEVKLIHEQIRTIRDHHGKNTLRVDNILDSLDTRITKLNDVIIQILNS
jgi:hypothetical protein